jgi:hypothetical protein
MWFWIVTVGGFGALWWYSQPMAAVLSPRPFRRANRKGRPTN